MTRLVFLSDTHNQHEQVSVPECDILVHSGDATTTGTLAEMANFAEWFEKQPGKHKLFVPGNHDLLFRDHFAVARALFKTADVVTYGFVEYEGLKFLCSSYSPEYGKRWAFHYPRTSQEAYEHWVPIRDNDYDVIVTHGPPLAILDKCSAMFGEKNAGCRELLQAVLARPPVLHVFGHIHHGYGAMHLDPQDASSTLFLNAALNSDDYNLVNVPWVVDVADGHATVVC